MLFNSIDFAIYLPIVFILYWFLFNRLKTTGRNTFLLTASYIFYGFWDVRFLSLIIITSILDYFLALWIDKSDEKSKRKVILIVSLVTNLGVLGFFKYYNFFVESFVFAFSYFGKEFSYVPLNIILPVGISFYTFQSLSYTLDVYYKRMKPTTNVINFMAFVSFFPQLVAGPIERAQHLLPQFDQKKVFNYQETRRGLLLIALGLFKKMVIADRIAIYVNSVYGNLADVKGTALILAVFFFAFQLYLDFSAYSQIAIGTAKLFGFQLTTNFRRPYLSSSFSNFWKRWHITLSSWFQDYIYIPLGGNRKGNVRTAINVMIVFILSGLWHGASWNFVIWGGLNGLFLIIFDKVFHLKGDTKGIKRILSAAFVFSCWALSLIFFRAQTFSDSLTVFQNIGFSDTAAIYNYGLNKPELKFAFYLILFIMLIEIIQEKSKIDLMDKFYTYKGVIRWCVYLIIILTILYLGSYGTANDNSFIYFQF